MKGERFTAYVTKHCLTKGIQVTEVEDCRDGMVRGTVGRYFDYYHKGEWYRNRHDAVIRAEEMRRRRIVSLEKSLQKIKGMRFNQE